MEADQIGQLIAKMRERLGITQIELAEKCGLSKWTIHNYEKLTSCPRFDDAAKILKVLGYRVRIEKIKKDYENKNKKCAKLPENNGKLQY